jgi:hypothetical protein
METGALINLAGNLSAVGFVCWLAHRLTTQTIPDMAARFTDASDKQRADFRETLEKQRADFHAFHQQEHESHEARLQKVMDKCVRSAAERFNT